MKVNVGDKVRANICFLRWLASEPSEDLQRFCTILVFILLILSGLAGLVLIFGSAGIARTMIMAMDAWTFMPFMMIMILAGLQTIPRELYEASEVDGASRWRQFLEITFPLMLPVSISSTDKDNF